MMYSRNLPVAELLVIRPRTVNTHLTSIFSKIGISTRVLPLTTLLSTILCDRTFVCFYLLPCQFLPHPFARYSSVPG
jgi:hypothetical protein